MSQRATLSILGAIILFAPTALTLRAADAPDLQWMWKGFERDQRFEASPHLRALASNDTYQAIWRGACGILAEKVSDQTQIQESVSAFLMAVPSSDVFLEVWTDSETVDAFNLAVRGQPLQMGLVAGAAQTLGWEEFSSGALKGAPERSWRVVSESPEGGRLEITGFGEWTLARFHQNDAFSGGSLLENILVHNRPWGEPTDALISLALSPSAFKSTPTATTPWSRIGLDLTLEGDSALLSGSIEFETAPDIDFSKWRLPTESIRDPLASFTAVRNPTEWLSFPSAWIAALPDELRSNDQYFLWSEDHGWSMPYVTRFASTFDGDAVQWLDGFADRVVKKLGPVFEEKGIGELKKNPDPLQLNWLKIPLLLPHLRAEKGASGSFFIGGVFPLERYTDEPPEALLSAIRDSENLVLYDWEITPVRFFQATSIKSKLQFIYDIATIQREPGNVSPIPAHASWTGLGQAINKGSPNAITKITAESPTRWNITRRSGFGLTGLEMILGLSWLEEVGALDELKNQPSGSTAVPIPTPR